MKNMAIFLVQTELKRTGYIEKQISFIMTLSLV